MRLTLRSLLGYLDDILEPQQTKELGEKISESSFAAGMVAKIRDVVRRRRITAPEVMGPGSDPDPNVVAEYLDNTLAPDKVEDLERLCLESDVHLAEVASSHQILTMVLGEPVDVPQATRERMYALGSVQDGTAAPRPAPAAAALMPSPQPKVEVPEYLSSGVSWRQVIPAAAALLVLGVWLGLIFSDPTMKSWRFWDSTSGTSVVHSDTTLSPASDPANIAHLDVDLTPQVDMPPEVSTEVAAAISTPSDLPPLPPSSTNEPPPSPGNIAITAPAAFPVSPNTMTATAPAATPASAAPPPAVTDADATPITAAPVAETRLLYNAVEGVLLRRDPADGWQVLPRRTLLHVGDDLASPEPFDSSLQVLDSDCEIVIAGGGRATILPLSDENRAAIEVDRGRVIFRRSVTAPLPDPTLIAIHVDDLNFTLELLTPGGECGLEIFRQLSAGPPERAQSLSFDGVLYITSGTARIRLADGKTITSEPSPSALAIINGQLATTLQPLLSPPDWLTPLTGGAAVVAQQSARQFEEKFQLGTPIDATVPPLIEDRYPRLSELATKTLTLLDDVPDMVRALSAPHQESRVAALIGLAQWVRRDPGNVLRLSDELGRRFTADEAEHLMRLIWGYSAVDAQNLDISQQLVQWLGDANVAVREAAFFHILRLTGGQMTFSYHPDRSESQRAASVKRWESHVQKLGGLVESTNPPAVPSAI
ncbi:MAG: hypothetical protein ACK5Q5_06925 [Planctomycetaceae bacterium]